MSAAPKAWVAPKGDDPETYLKIVFVLVPIYAVVIIGWTAGAQCGAAACSIAPHVDRCPSRTPRLLQAASVWLTSSCSTA